MATRVATNDAEKDHRMMPLGPIRGLLRRRLLVNFRVDPAVIQKVLPSPFVPKLVDGSAIAGICLIRLEQIRPSALPLPIGFSSENAAHRFAVRWQDAAGDHEGVYIPRRDTDSFMTVLAGGRIFPSVHHRAHFDVKDEESAISLDMRSVDGVASVSVRGTAATMLPATSHFGTLENASRFFELGAVGYSPSASGKRLEGINFGTDTWSVEPIEVEHATSSFFSDRANFPEGSVEFDCALRMRNINLRFAPVATL
jgi:hypothetical protein